MRGAVMMVCAMVAVASADVPRTVRIVADGACDLTELDLRSNDLLGREAITAHAAAQLGIFTGEEASGVTATLTFADANGVARSARTLEASTCDELVDSIAVVISLLLRDDHAAARPVSAPAVSSLDAPQPVAEVAYAPSLRTMNGLFELSGTMGTAGATAIVIGGRVDRPRHAYGIELHAGKAFSKDLVIGSVHVHGGKLDAVACLRRGGFGACGIAMAGLVRGRGEDLMRARTLVLPIAGVGARIEWRQPMSRWGGLRMFADVEQLLATSRFLVDDAPVWTSDARQIWLGAGIYFRGP